MLRRSGKPSYKRNESTCRGGFMSVLKLRNPPPGLSISSTGREEAVVVGSVPYVDGVLLEATARYDRPS
ncbi:hypothetical protein Y032_0008g291 [Ancylostoma ceylanicum]|uniref:Uncharacterized protein n=1 Tax=Ancylostoma ceylanicum TaxID=53326 RepID=A0A016VMN1_9BILA|nr:hypothetical protein Y032_0008g291 [Ancylostoma ceylanicum]